jgi:Polyketide cyclase / dehydrase and lipid transport
LPRIEVSRTVPVSLKEGFDYVTQIRNWPKFLPGYVGVDDEEHVSWGKPGDKLTLRVRNYGRVVAVKMHLDEVQPYVRILARSEQPGLPDFRHERYFRDEDGAFGCTNVIAFEPRSGFKGLIDRFVLPVLIRRNLRKTLGDLGRIFEDRQAPGTKSGG